MRFGRWIFLVAIAAGCSSARFGANETGAPSLIFPAHFAEGHTGKDEADGGARGGVDGGAFRSHKPGFLPDPEPLVLRQQWQFDFEYARGQVKVLGARRIDFGRPVATPRKMGRFALELWVGRELVDRVRFDFPLLGADEPPTGPRHPLKESPRFSPGADTRKRVLVPASDRATSARLVDRLTGAIVSIPWPPDRDGGAALPAPGR